MIRAVTLTILFFATQNALAQADRASCPGLNDQTSAEQQVSCWLERAQGGSAECAADRQGVNACALQAARWCAEAAFDEPSVANICFFAYFQAGQFEEAQALKRYLHEPTADVTRCLQALEATKVKFVSVPAGADLLVHGHLYGKTPVEVELRGEWWKDKVVAMFGDGTSATKVEVTPQELMAAFDRKACVMAEVTVKGPEEVPPAPVAEPLPSKVVEPPTDTPMKTRGGVSLPGVVSLVLGGAGVVTGVVLLAIAATRASDLRSQKEGTTWDSELENKHKSLEPLGIGGGIALGVGAALATAGVVLIAMDTQSSTTPPVDKASHSLRLTGQGIEWTGRF